MKVAIVGDATRTHAWEQHLMPHNIVKEVILSPTITGITKADACFLLDESKENLDTLIKVLQRGLHTFLVARLPMNVEKLEKVKRISEEARVEVLFAHWPSLASATQFMAQVVEKPTFINITREIPYSQTMEPNFNFRHLWIDEVGFCLKLMNSGVHHLEAKKLNMQADETIAIQLFIRFENGGTASIFINAGSSEHRHKRIVADQQSILECDVQQQIVREGRLNSSNNIFFKKEEFDPAKSAEKAALHFLKSIQIQKEPAFNIHHLLNLARTVKKIEGRIVQF